MHILLFGIVKYVKQRKFEYKQYQEVKKFNITLI